MSPAVIGDSFPEKDKKEFAERNLIPGSIILCYFEPARKEKWFVVIGINSDKSMVATLLFNTDKPFAGNKVLESLQVHFKSQSNIYLKNDSYVNCAHIKVVSYKKLFDELVVYPKHLLGKMPQVDFDRICTIAANAKTISKKYVNMFGLTGYLLQK